MIEDNLSDRSTEDVRHSSSNVARSEKLLWVIIPAYNEARVIADVLRQVCANCSNVVVVDDGSTDDTASISKGANAHVVRHPINLGQGAALETGIQYALLNGAQYVATFDADGQHSIDDVLEMLDRLIHSGVDIVIGSRFLGDAAEIPWNRRLILRLATLFTNLTSGISLSDAHNGLRVMTASTAAQLHIQQNRMAHASEIVSTIKNLRLRYVESPVRVRYTAYSISKGQRFRDIGRILGDLFTDWISR